MNIEQLRDKAIERGIDAAKRDYNRPEQAEKLRGSIAGFERCRQLPLTYEHYEAEIDRLQQELDGMRRRHEIAGYWERRCFQAEVQWVFEILKCAWRRYPLSGRAMLAYNQILGAAT